MYIVVTPLFNIAYSHQRGRVEGKGRPNRNRLRNVRICNKNFIEERETVRQVASVRMRMRMRARMRSGARALKIKEKAERPSDVNNTRGPGKRAEFPFKLKGGPNSRGPFIKYISLKERFYARARALNILRSSNPDQKANKEDRLLRCHSSKRSEGYYSGNNTTSDLKYTQY